MTTEWIEENWWFPWASAEEAKVEAFLDLLKGKAIEFYDEAITGWRREQGKYWTFNVRQRFRPIHPNRAMIDHYEPGQEWEVFISTEKKWISVQGVPQFYSEYQYRPKPARAWQDEFEEWAKGRVLWHSDGEALRLAARDDDTFIFIMVSDKDRAIKLTLNTTWRMWFHEAEEYIEPYTQETLPWPLVVRMPYYNDRDCMVLSSDKANVHLSIGAISYSALAQYKTPTGEPCGIRKWRKKSETAK